MSHENRIELHAPGLAHALMAIARALRSKRHRPEVTRLAFGLPTSIREDGTMANYQLKNDSIDTFPIMGVDDATQQPAALPPGDTFTATSDNAAVNAAITAADANGNPTLTINATVRAASSVTVTVADSAGSKVATLLVDVVADVVPEDLVIDTTKVTHATQSVPPV